MVSGGFTTKFDNFVNGTVRVTSYLDGESGRTFSPAASAGSAYLGSETGYIIKEGVADFQFGAGLTKILEADQVKVCLKDSVPPGTEELNLKAFDRGRALFKG